MGQTKSTIQSERRCTFCNNPDVQDAFHITLCCAKFDSLRVKYIKPYYYRRPSMLKFVELISIDNRRDIHRLMMFLNYTLTLCLNDCDVVIYDTSNVLLP